MYKVGVIGDKDSIFSFKSLGIETFSCEEGDIGEVTQLIKKMVAKNYGVIFITENIAQHVLDLIDRYQKCYLPVIVLIPNSQGSLGIGISRINENVEKAIGINIL
ncbi:V-type ATP synthase subunit F [Candidatus Arthromitus sp. SFB-rat-Yit]|uniref:V-type ATP synthase subunit F n=1 Tax=Candidatus Arthromitus sp. SFB-rat-Yit TaxID=1041504 RepID=UPI000227A2E2|nr:V-type ATP synthase subunit F [Candidatus Arthromitus sp. SFB-rat-Yit]BAK80814.1 ATP synthase, subunit F [Candidatus Arthromitus sp. SFB-rat-Yit]